MAENEGPSGPVVQSIQNGNLAWVKGPGLGNEIVDHVIVGSAEMTDGEKYYVVALGRDVMTVSGQDLAVERVMTYVHRIPPNRMRDLARGVLDTLGDEVVESLGYVRKPR
ncbi:hypothetical protein SAMN02800692_1545 [Luteibacter sp. UNC138MFCol5.1]|nr:hypothetical protein SAMN02800692_1545 [Luteibacter sp. UNC138MFCol5.1]